MPGRVAVGLLLVGVGWLASPNPVPIYDGISAPDEPYRFVSPPSGATKTAPPTSASVVSPVRAGASVNGMSVTTAEQGPQFSLFLPAGGVAGPDGTLTVSATPEAATTPPPGYVVDGNAYTVALVDGPRPTTLTAKAAIATLYLRATTSRQPGPSLFYRPTTTEPWTARQTSRGGQDLYVGAFVGAGQYMLAFEKGKAAMPERPIGALVVIGMVVLLAVIVVAVRLSSARSEGDDAPQGST